MSPQKLSNSPPNAPPPAPPVRKTFDASPEWIFNCFLSDRWLPRCRWCQTGTLPMVVAWPGRPKSSRRRTITTGFWRRFSQVCGAGIDGILMRVDTFGTGHDMRLNLPHFSRCFITQSWATAKSGSQWKQSRRLDEGNPWRWVFTQISHSASD